LLNPNASNGNPAVDTTVPWSTLTTSATLTSAQAATVAYAKVTMYGIDGSYWAGDYGPWYRAPTLQLNGGGNLLYNPEFGPYNNITAQGWSSSPGFGACQGAWGGSNACIVNSDGVPGSSTVGLVANANGGGPDASGGTLSGTAGGYNSTMSVTNAGTGATAGTPTPPPPAPTGPVAVTNAAGTTDSNPSGTTVLTVTNAGTYTNSGTTGDVTNQDTGTFTNNAGGTTGAVTNAGTFNNAGTTGNVINSGTFTNDGTTGTVNNSGTFTNNNITGDVRNSGVFTNNGTVSSVAYNNYLIYNHGTVTGDVTNGGHFNNYSDGTVGGTITSTQDTSVYNGGVINAVVLQSNAVLANEGTVATVTTDADTTVNNYVGGVITNGFTNDGTLNNAGTVADIVNNNVFNNSGTAGAVTNNGTFTNSGTTGDWTNSNTVTNTGTMGNGVNYANATFTNGGTVGTVDNQGTFNNAGTTGDWINNATVANAGTMGNGTNYTTFANTGTVGAVNNQGTFANTGTVASLTNSGIFTQSTGDLNLTSYTQTSTGSTVINGGQKVVVSGTANLGGNLTVVNGPTALGKYTYLTAAPVTGQFDSYTGTGVLRYTSTGVQVWVMPDGTVVQTGVNNLASSLSSMNALASGSLTGAVGSDCATFGQHGGCLSVNYGKTKVANGDLNSAGITYVEQLGKHWRAGVFAGDQLNSPTVSGIKYQSSSPAVGGLVGWNMNADGRGLGFTVSAVQGKGNYTIGNDKTNVDGKAYQIKGTYNIAVNDTTSVTPYIGVRKSSFNVNGYTQSGEMFPQTYGSVKQSTTDALAGVILGKQITDKLSGSVSVGVVKNINYQTGSVTSTSDMGNFNAPLTGGSYTSVAFGAGLGYEVVKNQRVGVNFGWQQKSLTNASVGSVGASYTVGF
jgi:hypothetical protein